MQAIEGIYQNGHIRLLETPKETRRSRVLVTFLDDDEREKDYSSSMVGTVEIIDDDLEAGSHSLSNLREILDDDLEAGSLEIREQFLRTIE